MEFAIKHCRTGQLMTPVRTHPRLAGVFFMSAYASTIEMAVFRKILVGLDGSEAARHALEQALELAALCGAEVHVLSVEEHLPAYAATVGEVDDEERFESRYFSRLHHEARRLAERRRVTLHTAIIPGHAAQALVQQAKAGGFDLVVIGHTGHSHLHTLFLGSTADRVVEHAPCAVLVVR
jgi:nucleotide-binding universal stress UspA family protein